MSPTVLKVVVFNHFKCSATNKPKATYREKLEFTNIWRTETTRNDLYTLTEEEIVKARGKQVEQLK